MELGLTIRRTMVTVNNQAIQNQTPRLPAEMTRTAQSYGLKILSALDRLGFVHENRDGTVFVLRFSETEVWYDLGKPAYLRYVIDAERMWHFSPTDIAKPRVVAALQMVCRQPVWVTNVDGLAITVELMPGNTAQAHLPARADLDLSTRPQNGDLMIPIGVSRGGALWHSLHEVGHMLITGTTGSGKTTWLHSAIAALVTGAGPEKLRLALIDLKRSEMALWANVPHTFGELAYTVKQATQVLGELVAEVNLRGDTFTAAGVRDIASYNRIASEKLPYIVCVVDEALDLLESAGPRSELVGHLKTVAMRGRSVGVYLWMASQHAASVTGLPRVVSTNLITRLVFRVLDGPAAQSAGCPGAQDIPKNRPGQMLAKLNARPIEVQGYALRDGVLKAIARTVAGQTVTASAGPALSEREVALVRYAVEQLHGAFVVGRLTSARLDGWSEWGIRRLAEQWEIKGWLTSPQYKGGARHVTPELASLAGVEL